MTTVSINITVSSSEHSTDHSDTRVQSNNIRLDSYEEPDSDDEYEMVRTPGGWGFFKKIGRSIANEAKYIGHSVGRKQRRMEWTVQNQSKQNIDMYAGDCGKERFQHSIPPGQSRAVPKMSFHHPLCVVVKKKDGRKIFGPQKIHYHPTGHLGRKAVCDSAGCKENQSYPV